MKKTHISHGEHWEAFVLRDRVNSEELYTHYFNIFYWILKKLRAKNSRLVKLQRETVKMGHTSMQHINQSYGQ